MMDNNWHNWQVHGISVLVLLQLAGRIWKGLRAGGGVVGIGKTILFGNPGGKEIPKPMIGGNLNLQAPGLSQTGQFQEPNIKEPGEQPKG